jgi:hypothetical protein
MWKQIVNNDIIIAYKIVKNDCETMAKAYVDDICQFLDIAHQ